MSTYLQLMLTFLHFFKNHRITIYWFDKEATVKQCHGKLTDFSRYSVTIDFGKSVIKTNNIILIIPRPHSSRLESVFGCLESSENQLLFNYLDTEISIFTYPNRYHAKGKLLAVDEQTAVMKLSFGSYRKYYCLVLFDGRSVKHSRKNNHHFVIHSLKSPST